MRFIASNFLANILIRSLFLLPNFMGLVNSGDLNKGFSYFDKSFDFGKFFYPVEKKLFSKFDL